MPYLFLILATLFWSGNFVVSRGMHAEIPPFSLSFWRWMVALLILAPFALKHCKADWELLKKNRRFIIIQGLLGVGLFNTLIYLAVQKTTAINAVLVNSCIPVLIVVCSWILYKEILGLRQCCGVILSLCGVVYIISRGDPAFLTSLHFNGGDVLVLAAALSWAFYSAYMKNYPQGLHPLSYLLGITVVGLSGIFPFFVFETMQGKHIPLSLPHLATVIYVALFASVLAFLCWNGAVREVGANKAGPFIHLMPVFSTTLAVFFLGEKIHGYHVLGICLIFTGITLTTLKLLSGKRLH